MGRTDRNARPDTASQETRPRPPASRRHTERPPASAEVTGDGMQGRIDKIVADKGFGFLIGDNGVKYFFHYSVCVPKNRMTFDMLYEGERVTFNGQRAEKGPRAEMVASLEDKSIEERTEARENLGNKV